VAHLAFVFCCLVWGSTFILLERVSHVLGPVEIGIWRMFSGAAAVGICWRFSRGRSAMRPADWINTFFVALLFMAPVQIVQAYVMSQGFGHSFFGTMVAGVPLLTILVSVPMLGTRPTARELVGVLGGLVCMWFLVEDGVDRGMSAALLLLALSIPLLSALNNTVVKWKLPNVPAAPLTTLMLLGAGLVLLPLQFTPGALAALRLPVPTESTVPFESVVYLFLLGVVGSGLSTMAFMWMVLKKGPLFAGMTTYVVPVLALLWGQVDSESISSRQLAAIVGVLAMVALVQSGSRREIEHVGAESPLHLVAPREPIAALAADPQAVVSQPPVMPETLAS
jgi:drug/metabolite transporter (DMT)-like permease